MEQIKEPPLEVPKLDLSVIWRTQQNGLWKSQMIWGEEGEAHFLITRANTGHPFLDDNMMQEMQYPRASLIC